MFFKAVAGSSASSSVLCRSTAASACEVSSVPSPQVSSPQIHAETDAKPFPLMLSYVGVFKYCIASII